MELYLMIRLCYSTNWNEELFLKKAVQILERLNESIIKLVAEWYEEKG